MKNRGFWGGSNDRRQAEELKQELGFEIEPIRSGSIEYDLAKKVELDSGTKMAMSNFACHMIPLFINQSPSTLYRVSFPAGMPHTLMQLKQGGFGSPIQGVDGKMMGSASFFPVETLNVLGTTFEIASMVVAQYYLAEINTQLMLINEKLDSILEFLYGDKKAELLAEMDFIRYAYHNYLSIMRHEPQRQAVLVNLQEARKVATKDIEFYLNDLGYKSVKKFSNAGDLEKLCNEIEKTRNCIELSTQVYLMSGLLEIYYSQNFDPEYLSYIEQDILSVMNRCDRRMIGDYSSLVGRIQSFNTVPLPFGNLNKAKFLEPLNNTIRALNDNQDRELKKTLEQIMKISTEPTQFYLQINGDIRMVDQN